LPGLCCVDSIAVNSPTGTVCSACGKSQINIHAIAGFHCSCANPCLLFHLLLFLHSLSVGFCYNLMVLSHIYELFFLCLVGRLDSAFCHGELVVSRIYLLLGPRCPCSLYTTKFCDQHCSSLS
jgi:hypothetical protein